MSERRRCTGLNKKGEPCGAAPLHGQDVCLRHSMSDTEWQAQAVLGGKRRAAKHERMKYLPRAQQERVLEVIARLLDATLPDGEPNMLERALGVWLACTHFQVRDKWGAIELLKEIRPSLADDPQLTRLLDFEQAQETLRSASDTLLDLHRKGLLAAHELPAGVLESA